MVRIERGQRRLLRRAHRKVSGRQGHLDAERAALSDLSRELDRPLKRSIRGQQDFLDSVDPICIRGGPMVARCWCSGAKARPEELRTALQGRIMERHRFLLRPHLRQVAALDVAIGEIDAEVTMISTLAVTRFACRGQSRASVT